MTDPNDSYKVGYGSPPKEGQFKKGQSGNPDGRPKGAKNRKTILEKILAEKGFYREGAKRKEVTKLELLIHAIRLGVANGDTTAMRLYDKLMGLGDFEADSQPCGLLITRRRLSLEEWTEQYGSGDQRVPSKDS